MQSVRSVSVIHVVWCVVPRRAVAYTSLPYNTFVRSVFHTRSVYQKYYTLYKVTKVVHYLVASSLQFLHQTSKFGGSYLQRGCYIYIGYAICHQYQQMIDGTIAKQMFL